VLCRVPSSLFHCGPGRFSKPRIAVAGRVGGGPAKTRGGRSVRRRVDITVYFGRGRIVLTKTQAAWVVAREATAETARGSVEHGL